MPDTGSSGASLPLQAAHSASQIVAALLPHGRREVCGASSSPSATAPNATQHAAWQSDARGDCVMRHVSESGRAWLARACGCMICGCLGGGIGAGASVGM